MLILYMLVFAGCLYGAYQLGRGHTLSELKDPAKRLEVKVRNHLASRQPTGVIVFDEEQEFLNEQLTKERRSKQIDRKVNKLNGWPDPDGDPDDKEESDDV